MGHVLGGLTVAGAILLSAGMGPTDPVLAGDVQVGPPLEGWKHIVRFALTTEAAVNDGLAFPFVYLGLLVAAEGLASQAWFVEWLAVDVVWRIVIGTVMGGAGLWGRFFLFCRAGQRWPIRPQGSSHWQGSCCAMALLNRS